MIYVVIRRYTVEDAVYVEAESKTDARRKAEDLDYFDQSSPETVSNTTLKRATPRPDLTIDYNGDAVVRKSASSG